MPSSHRHWTIRNQKTTAHEDGSSCWDWPTASHQFFVLFYKILKKLNKKTLKVKIAESVEFLEFETVRYWFVMSSLLLLKYSINRRSCSLYWGGNVWMLSIKGRLFCMTHIIPVPNIPNNSLAQAGYSLLGSRLFLKNFITRYPNN